MKHLLPNSTWSAPIVPPPLADYPAPVKSLIANLHTPHQVQAWIRTLQYNTNETMRTLPGVVANRRAHCLEAALSTAAILEYHGYPPLILDLESADPLDHTLFIYRHHGRYGTVGMSRDIGLAGRQPVFRTVESLVRSYAAPYIDAQAQITAYGVLDLRTLPRRHWRNSSRSVWYVELALHHIPHYKLILSPAFVRTWRRRYIEWHRRYPDRQPTFYPNQHQWL